MVPRRILVVEDNQDAREALSHLLELDGHEVRQAVDGPSAVEEALRWRPELALIDIGLPGIDGYEVVRRIRTEPVGRGMVLIALTGYGLPEDRQRAQEAGFDRHLVKPIDATKLAEVLAMRERDLTRERDGGRTA
jgi:CheY-like chemotaxis protein